MARSNMKKLLFILIFCLTATSSMAATYYVDESGGSDANDGLSAEAAWQTMTKIATVSAGTGFSAGDTISFKCGETWNYDNNHIANIAFYQSGTEGSPITFNAYGDCTGDNPPTFDGFTTPITGGWTEAITNVWQKSTFPVNYQRVFLDGKEYNERNMITDLDTTLATITNLTAEPARPWYLHYATATLYLYSTQNPDDEYTGDGVQVMRPAQLFYFRNGCDYITIQDLKFMGSSNAIQVQGPSDNFIIKDNIFRYIGYNVIRTDSGAEYNDFTITGNDSDFVYDPTNHSDYTDPDDRGPEDTLALYGTINNFYIANNTFKNSGHTEINLNDNAGSGTIIEYNDLSGPTSIYARGFGIAGTGNIIRNNYLHDLNIRNQVGGIGNKVYNNVFNLVRGDGNVIYYSEALLLGTIYVTTNNEIYNNTFIDCWNGCLRLIEGAGGDVSGNILKNNVFIQTVGATESSTQLSPMAQGVNIFEDVGIGNNTVENNYFDNTEHPSVIKVGLTWYTQAEADAGVADFSNNYSGNISLNSDGSINFGSPLMDIGEDLSSVLTDDINGVTRPRGSAFDIGAYEVGANTQLEGISISGIGIGN